MRVIEVFEMFENNVPQTKSARYLHTSLTIEHDLKLFKKSGGISMLKRLDNHHLSSFRWHSIRNHQ